MTDNKTGSFIAFLRKEKGLTQLQLAEMLNVTDKAISRWETGKGLPESTLLIPLSKALDVTVNELLTGERISEEKYFQKSDDNLVSAVQKTEKAVKQRNLTKTFLKIAIVIFTISISLLTTAIYLMSTSIYEAKYTYDDDGFFSGISFGNTSYVYWNDVDDKYIEAGVINNTVSSYMFPYYLVSDNLREKKYISDNFIEDLLPPYSYFSFSSEGNDFIFEQPDDTSLNLLLVREGFIFPDIYKNEIDEVWMSLDYKDNGNIKDETIINKIVNCAKNKKAQELDKDIYDYISEKSWDNCHFYLKYKGYPLVEKFFITRTKDSRYVISQNELS